MTRPNHSGARRATRTADGVLCRADRPTLLKEVREAIAALLEYEAKLISEGE